MNPACNPLEWGSHLPALLACVASTVGDVLELGIGHCSTPHLHALCVQSDRNLTSIENDPAWYEQFASRYAAPRHTLLLGDYASMVPEMAKRKWGVSFIDNSPGGERRRSDFASLIGVSQFIVLHDYHRENEEMIAPLLNGLKWKVTSLYEPPTLIASAVRVIPDAIK